MPRRYEIDAAWRAAITREQDGRQTVTTAAFVQDLHKFNWHWTPRRANQWIETYVSVYISFKSIFFFWLCTFLSITSYFQKSVSQRETRAIMFPVEKQGINNDKKFQAQRATKAL